MSLKQSKHPFSNMLTDLRFSVSCSRCPNANPQYDLGSTSSDEWNRQCRVKMRIRHGRRESLFCEMVQGWPRILPICAQWAPSITSVWCQRHPRGRKYPKFIVQCVHTHEGVNSSGSGLISSGKVGECSIHRFSFHVPLIKHQATQWSCRSFLLPILFHGLLILFVTCLCAMSTTWRCSWNSPTRLFDPEN